MATTERSVWRPVRRVVGPPLWLAARIARIVLALALTALWAWYSLVALLATRHELVGGDLLRAALGAGLFAVAFVVFGTAAAEAWGIREDAEAGGGDP